MADDGEKALVEKKVLGDLTESARRWQNRAHAIQKKRRRWECRALAAEAENERMRDALERIAEYGGGDGGDWVECCNIARDALSPVEEGEAG